LTFDIAQTRLIPLLESFGEESMSVGRAAFDRCHSLDRHFMRRVAPAASRAAVRVLRRPDDRAVGIGR
jgi:hypothetical protein